MAKRKPRNPYESADEGVSELDQADQPYVRMRLDRARHGVQSAQNNLSRTQLLGALDQYDAMPGRVLGRAQAVAESDTAQGFRGTPGQDKLVTEMRGAGLNATYAPIPGLVRTLDPVTGTAGFQKRSPNLMTPARQQAQQDYFLNRARTGTVGGAPKYEDFGTYQSRRQGVADQMAALNTQVRGQVAVAGAKAGPVDYRTTQKGVESQQQTERYKADKEVESRNAIIAGVTNPQLRATMLVVSRKLDGLMRAQGSSPYPEKFNEPIKAAQGELEGLIVQAFPAESGTQPPPAATPAPGALPAGAPPVTGGFFQNLQRSARDNYATPYLQRAVGAPGNIDPLRWMRESAQNQQMVDFNRGVAPQGIPTTAAPVAPPTGAPGAPPASARYSFPGGDTLPPAATAGAQPVAQQPATGPIDTNQAEAVGTAMMTEPQWAPVWEKILRGTPQEQAQAQAQWDAEWMRRLSAGR